MNVYHLTHTNIPKLPATSCCIGYFDGMHKGHQALIANAKEKALQLHVQIGLITFHPDPWEVFHPESFQQHLMTLQDKIDYLYSQKLDVVYVLEFTKEFASMDVDSFHDLLKQMNVSHLTCGFDFLYAQKNSGNTQTLKNQTEFGVSVIESINESNEKISSSRIEPLITQGRMVQANALLGFPYSVSGVIVHGFRRGSELLKIPTANLEVDYEYVLPEIGVYAGLVMVENNLYPAMINVGKNPTFNNQTMTVEAHILDFDRDIYDRKARFFFLEKTRGEIKFDHFNQLKDQLHQDIQATRQVLKSHGEMIDAARNIWLKVSL